MKIEEKARLWTKSGCGFARKDLRQNRWYRSMHKHIPELFHVAAFDPLFLSGVGSRRILFSSEGVQLSRCNSPTDSFINSGYMEKFRYVLMHRSIPSVLPQVFPCKPKSRFSPFIVGTIVGAESYLDSY